LQCWHSINRAKVKHNSPMPKDDSRLYKSRSKLVQAIWRERLELLIKLFGGCLYSLDWTTGTYG